MFNIQQSKKKTQENSKKMSEGSIKKKKKPYVKLTMKYTERRKKSDVHPDSSTHKEIILLYSNSFM